MAMPLGVGWHPYFKTIGTIDKLKLYLPQVEKIMVDSRLIPTGQKEPYADFEQGELIGKTAFDTGFVIKNSGGERVSTALVDQENNLRIEIWQEVGVGKFNYLQVYTPPGRQAVAIEPMSCATNAFNNGEGLQILPLRGVFLAKFGVSVVVTQ